MSCSTCQDTGLVAPDPFGHPESWDDYLAAVVAYSLKHEIPTWVSPMIRAQPCPACSSQAPRAGTPRPAGARASAVPGHDEELFQLGW